MAKKEQELRDKAKEAEKRGDMTTHDDLIAKADRQQHDMVLFDSITGAIYGPNSNGATGYVARAVAPQVSYQIGQYFKGTNGEGTAPHILAHGILAAAVSVATGNDPTSGALSAMGTEAGAKYVANYLFPDTKLSELTAEQKATVSSIMSLAGLGMGATTGDVGSAVSAGEVAQVAVDDNGFNKYAKESEATKQWKAQNRAFVVNQINGILEYKPFDLVYKVAANGDTIVCIPIGSYTCGLRLGEHFASPEEVRKGNSEFLMSVVPIPGVGGGAKVIAKETGQVIGIYKDAKAANAAIQRARVEANIATNKAARESSNFPSKNQQINKPSNHLVIYNPKTAYSQLVSNGKINESDLKRIIPNTTPDTFGTSMAVKDGFKYEYNINGTQVIVKWHGPDKNAAKLYPNSNSGKMWTAQIQIGKNSQKRFLGADGNYYRNPQQDITHIPVNMGK